MKDLFININPLSYIVLYFVLGSLWADFLFYAAKKTNVKLENEYGLFHRIVFILIFPVSMIIFFGAIISTFLINRKQK